MGQSKQLLPWKSETLLSHTINIVKASKAAGIYVVLGANQEAHRKAINSENINVIANGNWKDGMGTSLKAGINELQKDSSVAGVLILVCDQPFLSTAHLDAMIESFEKQKCSIVASVYDGTNGVPVLFGKEHFTELVDIGDDEGAKKVISSNQEQVIGIMFPEGSVDIDTPDEYQRARGL
jgi:molybdenum cofactor cytidylyltransferase